MSVSVSHVRLVECLATIGERFKFAEVCLWRLAQGGAEPVRFGTVSGYDVRQTRLTADPQRLVGYQKQIDASIIFTLDACDGGLLVVRSPHSPDVAPVALVASPSAHLSVTELADLRSEVGRLATLLALYDADVAALQIAAQFQAVLDARALSMVLLDRDGQVVRVTDGAGAQPTASLLAAPRPGENYSEWCRNLAAAGCPDGVVVARAVDSMARGTLSNWDRELFDLVHGRWVKVNLHRLTAPDAGGVAIWHDVTPEKKATLAQSERERHLHFLLDAVPAMIWVAERHQQRTYFNRAWLDFTGRISSQQCADAWMADVHPDDVGRCIEVYNQAFAVGKPFTVDYRLRRNDGTYCWIGETGVPWILNGAPAGFIGSALDVTDRRRAEDVSRELSGRLIVAQESERRRIAREVHDDLSQRAALLAIELERFAADSPPSGRQIAQRSTEFAHSAAELATDLHRLSHRLHPAKLEALGLVASIQGFCRELWTQHALQVHFDHHDVPARIPVDVSLCLYRIVQEGLLNVLKHSGTKKADVTLIGHDHELLLRIADPGQGFEKTQRGAVGLGLSSMRERVRSLSGDFVVHTAPGHGTRIGVKVRVDPVREKQSA